MTNPEPGVLYITLRRDGPDVWVDATGEVDVSTSDQLEGAVADGLTTAPARVYLDMHLVSFIDSFGLAVLVRCHQLADRQGCHVIVRSPAPQVARALALGGLDQYLRIET